MELYPLSRVLCVSQQCACHHHHNMGLWSWYRYILYSIHLILIIIVYIKCCGGKADNNTRTMEKNSGWGYTRGYNIKSVCDSTIYIVNLFSHTILYSSIYFIDCSVYCNNSEVSKIKKSVILSDTKIFYSISSSHVMWKYICVLWVHAYLSSMGSIFFFFIWLPVFWMFTWNKIYFGW